MESLTVGTPARKRIAAYQMIATYRLISVRYQEVLQRSGGFGHGIEKAMANGLPPSGLAVQNHQEDFVTSPIVAAMDCTLELTKTTVHNGVNRR